MDVGPFGNKVNNWPVRSHEIKNLLITKEMVNWVKKQPTELEKIQDQEIIQAIPKYIIDLRRLLKRRNISG